MSAVCWVVLRAERRAALTAFGSVACSALKRDANSVGAKVASTVNEKAGVTVGLRAGRKEERWGFEPAEKRAQRLAASMAAKKADVKVELKGRPLAAKKVVSEAAVLGA